MSAISSITNTRGRLQTVCPLNYGGKILWLNM
nr:MAG TPA: hypothetical protein [Caudoviricetes sp.]